MRILYDSKSEFHKSPFGCLKRNEDCNITILIPVSCQTENVFLVLEKEDGFNLTIPLSLVKRENEYEHFKASFSLFMTGLYFYYFKIVTKGSTFNLFKQGSDTNMAEGDKWQLSCIPESFSVSDDFKGRVYYQIFPDRFYKDKILGKDDKKTPFTLHEDESDIPVYRPDENGIVQNNDFFGGNLRGIEKKLFYLKELGVSVIYLNPIFSAYSNHRYDTSDYKKIDPLLGNEEDFRNLCESAHSLGMKVLLDGVFSHTGSDSIYFDKMGRYDNGAYNNPDSPYKDWYQFTDYPEKYTSWWGIDTLPCVNEMSDSFVDYIIDNEDSVISHWMKLGADGFRLDVADELPDEFIKKLHEKVHKIKPDGLVLGEVWEDASNKISYSVRRRYFTNHELDSVMNYPFRDYIISFVKGHMSPVDFSSNVMTICENYPEDVLHALMNSLSTHDTPRILTLLSDAPYIESKDERAKYTLTDEMRKTATERLKKAAFLQFCLPGSPCIYYGDEAGTEGFEDPFNRGFFPWGKEDKELLKFYKKLSEIKNSYASLRFGKTEFIKDENALHFSREKDGEKLFVFVGDYLSPDGKEILLSGNGFMLYKER